MQLIIDQHKIRQRLDQLQMSKILEKLHICQILKSPTISNNNVNIRECLKYL